MDSHDERIGALVRRYESNMQNIAGLTDALQCAGDEIATIGEALKSRPSIVTADRAEKAACTLGDVADRLRELRCAIDDKVRMDKCLEQAGLGRLQGSL